VSGQNSYGSYMHGVIIKCNYIYSCSTETLLQSLALIVLIACLTLWSFELYIQVIFYLTESMVFLLYGPFWLMLFGEIITTCSAGQVVLKYWRIVVPASFRSHSVCVRKHLALALHGWRWQRESRWWTSMVKGNCAVVWLHQTKCISGCVFLIIPAFSPIH
jgi:hypothetical protein